MPDLTDALALRQPGDYHIGNFNVKVRETSRKDLNIQIYRGRSAISVLLMDGGYIDVVGKDSSVPLYYGHDQHRAAQVVLNYFE